MPTEGSGIEALSVDIDVMSPEELRRKLEEMKLSTKGSKAVMAGRLRRAMVSETAKDKMAHQDGTGDEEDEADDVSENEGAADVDSLSLSELRGRLRALGLKMTGNKAALRDRLKAAINEQDDAEEDEDNDEDDSDNDEDDEEERAAGRNRGRKIGRSSTNTRETERGVRFARQITLSFKDVEDALETFSGDGSETSIVG